MALRHPKLEVIFSATLGGPPGTTGLRICSLLKPAMRRVALASRRADGALHH